MLVFVVVASYFASGSTGPPLTLDRLVGGLCGHIGERYFVNFLFAKETDKGIALENKSGG